MNRKYKILFLNETAIMAGAETVLFNIAANLDRDRFTPRAALFRQGWMQSYFQENGIHTDVIESKRSWDLSFLYRLIGYCRKYKIDLIHAHLPGANLYGSLAARILKIPVICTFHNEFSLPGADERFWKFKIFLIRKLASKLVMVAEYMREEYALKGKFPESKMVTVLNGVPVSIEDRKFDLQSFRKDIGYREGELLIANVANFRVPKGHEILVRSAAMVCGEIPHAKFLLIGDEGDGVIRERVLQKIRHLGLEDRVILMGHRKDVGGILRSVDIFLLASISEGLPLSAVEAMMAGLPVVATNVGGLSEVVDNGETGFLVPPHDHSAIAAKLTELLKDSDLRRKFGERGRETAQSRFSLARMISKYQKLYMEFLK